MVRKKTFYGAVSVEFDAEYYPWKEKYAKAEFLKKSI